jgi:hypothetical protein
MRKQPERRHLWEMILENFFSRVISSKEALDSESHAQSE